MEQNSTTGTSHPLGATLIGGGANFSLFSRSASGVELLFFDRVDDALPSRIIKTAQLGHAAIAFDQENRYA